VLVAEWQYLAFFDVEPIPAERVDNVRLGRDEGVSVPGFGAVRSIA
jgi:hypothetical protein